MQYYNLTDNRFYPGDQSMPVSVSDPVSVSYLPVQVFRQPEELEATYSRVVGHKRYELTDHLGNVHVVVSDRRILQGTELVPEVYSVVDYYPFGSERNSTVDGQYSFGFNGMMKDNEVKGKGRSYDFGARMYDPETGRWKSEDRVIKADKSSYTYAADNPIIYVDADGNDEFYYNLNYKSSKKVVLKEGQKSYLIPQWSYRRVAAGHHRYFYRTGTEKVFSGDYNLNQQTGRIEPVYNTEPTYIEINSPMTIRGGDANTEDQAGFSNLDAFPMGDMVQRSESFANQYSQGGSIVDVSPILNKLGKILNNYAGTSLGLGSDGVLSKVIQESRHGGDLDFKAKLNLLDNTLYEINGVYYNKNEAGNFGWGYAMAQLGFSTDDVEFLAHQGTMMLSESRLFDEPWELDAVLDGYNHYFNSRSGGNNQRETENIDMYTNPNK